MVATGAACGGPSTVEIVEDPVLETAFETVLGNGETRTVGDIADTAGIGGGWDRMYYFRVPLLMSEVNRSIGTASTLWENLPTTGADGVIIFMSGKAVVRAVIDHAPSLDLHGYATADSTVTANPGGARGTITVEAKGR